MTEPSSTLILKLAEIAGRLERFQKDQRTSGRGAFGFTSVNAIRDKLRPMLAEAGVVMYPEDIELIESVEVARQKEGDRGAYTAYQWRTVMRVTWVVRDETSRIEVQTVGEAMDTSDKSANKAMTAAAKYALVLLFNISTGDAETDHSDGGQTQSTSGGASAKQIGFLKGSLEKFARKYEGDTAEAKTGLLTAVAGSEKLKAHLDAIDHAVGEWDFDALPKAVVSDLIDLVNQEAS